jgi:hypothetical protein
VATQASYVPRPELRLFRFNGTDQNRTELEDQARSLADRYVATTANSRLYAAAGYVATELSGQVNQIVFRASPPTTTWQANTSFFPHVIRVKKTPAVKGKFPRAAETADRRTAEGMGGGQQPMIPVGPPAPPQIGTVGIVRITDKGAVGAAYTGKLQEGSATIKPTDLFKPNQSSAIPGMSDGQSVQVWNLLEGGDTHSLALPQYAPCERIGTAEDGTPIVAVRVKPAFLLFAVSLTKDDGEDGDATLAPTYKYTVKLGVETMGTKMTPQWGRSIGSFQAATVGMGYLDAEGSFVLAYAHEIQNTEACS